MARLTITAKGQVTFKQDLLKHLGVNPGQKIEVDKLPNGQIVVKAIAPNGSFLDFVGCLSEPDQTHLTIDEIDETTHQGWGSEHRTRCNPGILI